MIFFPSIDVGVHYWKNLVIFSDTAGTLHKREIDVKDFKSGFNTTSDIIYQSMGERIPTVVDVDWLFNQIYFVEENQVSFHKNWKNLNLVVWKGIVEIGSA